jgi:predicted RNase H-like nuclease (RuvC/YqgF family)
VQDNFDDLQKRYHDKENRVEELRHAADDARRSLESEHSARLKADREMREFATKLLDTQDEVKALKREMGDLERTSAAELAEKDSVSCFVLQTY